MIKILGFVSSKFNLIFFLISTLIIQKADLNVLFQNLLSFNTFLTKFCKETLAVTFLFQCYFLVVIGADNLV